MTTLPEISSTERFDVVTANENFQSVSPAAAFGIDWEETVALTLGVLGGIAPDGTEKADTTVALTGSQTNYVEMTTAGVVSSNTSAYTAGRVKLFRIVTNANGITSYTDDRSFSPGGLSVLGPTSSTDNAVARWDSTTGKRLQDSVVTISDTGAVAGATSLTIAQGTITDAANAFTVTSTWNDAADTMVGASIDITDTASATASLLLRLQVGGVVKFSVRKDGNIAATGNTGVNVAANANTVLTVSSPGTATGGTQTAVNASFSGTTSGTSAIQGYNASLTAPDGSGVTYATVIGFRANVITKSGAGDTITEYSGFRADANTAAALNLGFKGLMAVSGTARYNLYMSGTAPNYLAGQLFVGHTASVTTGQANIVQVSGSGSQTGGIGLNRYSADAVGTKLEFSKSRNATIGSNTIVNSGDSLGEITWYGADGSNYDPACQIIGESDGTPGSGTDMPGRLRFLTTPDGSATLTERMRIDKAGNVVINTAAIATNATDGFLYVPTCAGTPTGTPTTYTGRAPVVVDTTNHKLYFYDGSWRDAGP